MRGTALPLARQTVLITGAANGLGRAIAVAFHAAGSTLILVDVDREKLAELQATMPGAHVYVADLSDAGATRAMLMAVRNDHQAVHTLIHNAGFLVPQAFAEMTEQRWDLTFNVGVQAAYLLTKAFWAEWLQQGACVIYVSSRSGIEASWGEAPYCASKHALEGLVKALACEGTEAGVFVHSVTPGMYMRTPMSEQNYTDELKQKWVDPQELAPAFLYLAQRPDPNLAGKRLSAWELAQTVAI